MTGIQRISESLYHGLCIKVGTRQQVLLRRDFMDIEEIIGRNGLPYHLKCKMESGSRREGFRFLGSDIDTMFWFKYEKVIYDLSQFKEYNHLPDTTLILMESEQSPPGFALLQLLLPTYISRRREKLLRSCVKMNDRFYISSTLYREQMCSEIYPDSTVHGPCASGIHIDTEYDHAHCFKCDFWPQSALPMIHRCQTWPSLPVLHNIYNSGFHFVAKGNTLSPYVDNEWRISFSQAEQKLVYAMNHCQFLVYGLLKLFLKEVINQGVDDKLLCSYFMKTVVFWEIVENRIPCWCPQNMVVCFWSCFKHIIQWVYHGYCPNFFISQNNMFSGKIVGNKQHNLFQQLYGLYEQGYTCLLLIPSIRAYVVQVLCNRNIVVNLNEETLISELFLESEVGSELSNKGIFRGINLNTCIKVLEAIEHLTQTPLTQNHCIALQKLTSDILKIIPFHLHNRCRDGIRTKMIYSTDRAHCHMLKLAAKFGSISDMLYIAMYYYKTRRYTKALSVIEMIKGKFSQPFVKFRDMVNNQRCIDAVWVQSWSKEVLRVMRHHIILHNNICYISELRLEQQISLTNEWYVLHIPSQVMLHMLSVLCYNHVDIMKRQQALEDLYILLHYDVEFYVLDLLRDISYQILGLCQEACGDRLNALHSYQESLRQYPLNKIQMATQIRIQHVLEQLDT